MGNKHGKVSDHVAFNTDPSAQIPNIVITSPSPLQSPETPKPFAPPPSPQHGSYHYPEQPPNYAPPPTPHEESVSDWESSAETMILASTPPPDRPPPPPPSMMREEEEPSYEDIKGRYSAFASSVLSNTPDLPSVPPPTAAPRSGLPTIKRNIVYAKDRIAQFEALNTTDRKKENGGSYQKDQYSSDYYSIKAAKPSDYSPKTSDYTSSRFKPFVVNSVTNTTNTTTTNTTRSTKDNPPDDYPIYNPLSDFSFKSGTTFHQGTFPIDANRINIGICGRLGAGKSSMINALRGITTGDPQSAGRNPCDNMEPFRFLEESLQHIVLWEIPYPRSFSSVADVYDRNMGFDRFYESHKLHLFNRLFVLIPDGAPHDDDVSFARVVQSRRTLLTFLSVKTDDDLDAESRESGRSIDGLLRADYEKRARMVFNKCLLQKAQILSTVDLLFVSSPVIRNIVSGTTGFLHYKMDEEKMLSLIDLKAGCHYALENKRRREQEEINNINRPSRLEAQANGNGIRSRTMSPSMKTFPPTSIQKSSVMVDAGFEILYGTDDRVFGNQEPKTMVRRAGRTAFNYGFIGCGGVGKSAMINAMRGMSSKHPLAAGRTRAKAGSCERFEFDDDLLKYSVTLWELHYPKKVNNYFEFIDRHNISNFTAIFILIDGVPSDEDMSFAKIAHRRNAVVVFLSSKSDKKLSSRSRSDEIPVCDLLKQRYVDKCMARFDRSLAAAAPELCGRVHAFFVSAPVFRGLRNGDARSIQFVLHERAVFDFLKQKRIIADLLDSPSPMKEGLYANVNTDTAGVDIRDQ